MSQPLAPTGTPPSSPVRSLYQNAIHSAIPASRAISFHTLCNFSSSGTFGVINVSISTSHLQSS